MMLKSVVLFMLLARGYTQEENAETTDFETTVLDLSNKGLTSLKDIDFSKYTQVEKIDLSNNGLSDIEETTFEANPLLKQLDLSGNTNLQLPHFSTLLTANIEELNLSNCGINIIPESIFDGLTQIKVIDLSKNPLEKLEETPFSTLKTLEKITIPEGTPLEKEEICQNLPIDIELHSKTSNTPLNCNDNAEDPLIEIKTLSLEKESLENENTTSNTNDTEDSVDEPIELIDTLPQNSKPTEEKSTENNEDSTVTIDAEIDTNVTDTSETITPELDVEVNVIKNITDNTTGEDQSGSIANEEDKLNTVQSDVISEEPNSAEDLTEIHEHFDKENSPFFRSAPILPLDKENLEGSNASSEAITDEHKHEQNVDESLLQGGVDPPLNDENVPEATINETDLHEHKKVDTPSLKRIVPHPTNTANVEDSSSVQKEKSGQIVDASKSSAKEQAVSDSNTSGTGTNILVILLVGVVVIGAAALGYKFYNDRKYSSTSTEEPRGTELKEIAVDRNRNGANKPNNITEEEPLMERLGNSIEIREIDEDKLNEKTGNEDINGMTVSTAGNTEGLDTEERGLARGAHDETDRQK